MPIVSGFEVLKFIRSTKELKHLPVSVFAGNTYPKTNRNYCGSEQMPTA